MLYCYTRIRCVSAGIFLQLANFFKVRLERSEYHLKDAGHTAGLNVFLSVSSVPHPPPSDFSKSKDEKLSYKIKNWEEKESFYSIYNIFLFHSILFYSDLHFPSSIPRSFRLEDAT